MNLRILVYMNPLVVDKISKKFLWEKDSGFLYTKQLINNLPPNWRFTILVPKGFDPNFFPTAECVEYDYCTSIHQNRYHFNRNILAKTFPYGRDVDVIINNQPEVTANLKVFFENQRREKPIIINFFHWIDCKESAKFSKTLSGFIWRQVEGAREADLNMFHGRHAYDLFKTSAEENGLPYGNIKVEFFHPQPTKFGEEPMELPDKKIILFNHRLNNTTGWKEVIKACEEAHNYNDNFILWFTDDQNLKEKKYLEGFSWIKVQRISFKNYGYFIKKCHFSICNTKGYATWNMAVLDSIHNGCTPLVPIHPLYLDMLGGKIPTDFHGDLVKSIMLLLANPKERNDTWLNEVKIPEDTNLGGWIEDIIKTRIPVGEIKKYNDVKNHIIWKGKCEKREFVNKFWSFHANSNFQLIRWKLLNDGIEDDTTKENTTYINPNTIDNISGIDNR